MTGTLTGPCHTRDSGRLPDPRCTPGSYDPAVTQANLPTTLCVKHVSAGGAVTYNLSAAWLAGRPPESQTSHAKFTVVDPAYGISVALAGELDHLDAREIGGSNDLSNLWLEAGTIPNRKDAVENAAHKAVCSGRITLSAAQVAMAANWMLLGQQLGEAPALPPAHSPAPTAALAHPVVPSASAAPAPGACHPTTSSGHCYEPGEFCRKTGSGSSGVAGDGTKITCSNGRWEPAA